MSNKQIIYSIFTKHFGDRWGASLRKLSALLVEALDAKDNKWISVEDELPKPKKIQIKCLVNVNGSGVYLDRFIKESNQFHDYYGYVTHWQPLPEPPQGDK